MVSNDDLLLETLAFQQPAAFRSIRINVPEPQLGPEAFELRKLDTGGSAYLSHDADGIAERILLWEFTEEVTLLPLRWGARFGKVFMNAASLIKLSNPDCQLHDCFGMSSHFASERLQTACRP